MAIEVIAKSVNNFSEESLRIEKLENGEYKIIAKRGIIDLRSNVSDEIELVFTKSGYTKSHTSEIKQSDNTVKVVMSTKWTQKGRLFIYNLLKDEGYLPQMDLWDNVS